MLGKFSAVIFSIEGRWWWVCCFWVIFSTYAYGISFYFFLCKHSESNFVNMNMSEYKYTWTF